MKVHRKNNPGKQKVFVDIDETICFYENDRIYELAIPSKENIDKITKRFFREDNVRTHKKSGVGLGLSIVKHILEDHNGYLEISSEEGRGSTFKICLPKKK